MRATGKQQPNGFAATAQRKNKTRRRQLLTGFLLGVR
jgi:hypothetical protein